MCETGPNAILLSDLPIQNGQVCSRSEFPVLQMRYKQGMLIPGHPGNSGRLPLIMGSKKQVDAQMEYLFRGNYGLVSRQELTEAGASNRQASKMRALLEEHFEHLAFFSRGCVAPASAPPNARARCSVLRSIRTGAPSARTPRVEQFGWPPGGVEFDVDFHVIRGEPQVVHAAHRQRSFFGHGGGAISCSGHGGAPVSNCLRYCDAEAAPAQVFPCVLH